MRTGVGDIPKGPKEPGKCLAGRRIVFIGIAESLLRFFSQSKRKMAERLKSENDGTPVAKVLLFTRVLFKERRDVAQET